jgi:hypothetical protein
MKNEFLDLFKGTPAIEIAGMILAVVATFIAAYTQMKVSLLVRRDHDLAKKFRIDIKGWVTEAEQSFIKQKFGLGDKEDTKHL